MSLYSDPPPLHTFEQDKPTLLVCWWTTLFCATIILVRVLGRFIRSERLFKEDRVAALAVIPLFLRMGCVHVILLFGTNNAQLPSDLSDDDIRRKSIASGLVLASRMLHATTLWILKTAILEFFKRLTSNSWSKYHESTLTLIRCALALTLAGVLVSDLTECRPFHNYYQVLPDPGGQCRQGFVQLITMAACNVLTDLLLVIFPVTIIVRSHMTVKKKVQLVLLFSLSLGVVGTTCYRVPHVIWQGGNQQIRSLLASVELLFATAAANALVLGSFVRDRGVKKAKFRYGSITGESIDGSAWSSQRRPTLRYRGSDEDLVRSLGLRADRELRSEFGHVGSDDNPSYTPAPIAKLPGDMGNWQFPRRKRSHPEQSEDSLLPRDQLQISQSNTGSTPRKVSFFDVGGLLTDERDTGHRDSYNSSIDPLSPVSAYNVLGSHYPPTPSVPAATTGLRRGSQALLQDLGGLLGPSSRTTRSTPDTSPTGTELRPMTSQPTRTSPPTWNAQAYQNTPILKDPGGLLRR